MTSQIHLKLQLILFQDILVLDVFYLHFSNFICLCLLLAYSNLQFMCVFYKLHDKVRVSYCLQCHIMSCVWFNKSISINNASTCKPFEFFRVHILQDFILVGSTDCRILLKLGSNLWTAPPLKTNYLDKIFVITQICMLLFNIYLFSLLRPKE